MIINTNEWTALAARNRTAADYFRSPADNLREQNLNAKWNIEHVHDDSPIPDQLLFRPDFGCLRGVEFEMDITWLDDGPPNAHPLTDPTEIDDLEVPNPAGGLNARAIEWYHAMVETCQDIEVTLNGQPLEVSISLDQFGGPIPSAFALSGSNMFLWMAMDPERCTDCWLL